MSRLFGTDGVRGVANKDLNPLLTYHLGRAGAHVLSESHKKPVIVVGKDTRISGDMLEAALVAGICSAGADVLKVGVMPTPSIAFLTRHFNADAGVVISASHNPVEYNGIKFFNRDGYKLPDAMEDEIETLVKDPDGQIQSPVGTEVGKVLEENGREPYVDFVKNVADMDFSGLKIAVDCANGASYKVAPSALKALGAEVVVINADPDGCNINVRCGSTHPDALSEFVKKTGADIGLSFDGDADRLIAVDENGDIVDGDHIMAICASSLHRRGLLKNSTVVTTIMSNMGLQVALKKAGIEMVRTKVGDRYVLEEILRQGHNFGGEQSGHIIFLDHNTTGDGLITAVNLIKAVVQEKKPLSELAKIMKVYPQTLLNVKIEDKSRYAGNARIEEAVKTAQEAMGERGRIVVRPSGTEPLIRVMAEGEDEAEITRVAEDVAAVIKQELN